MTALRASIVIAFAFALVGQLVATAGVARADTRPTFTAELDPEDSLAARASAGLTTALRKLGMAKRSPYRHKGTKTQIFNVIADAECTLKQVACAVTIGERLGVDYMFAGEVVAKREWFVVVMHVVNVKTKKRVRTVREVMPKQGNFDKWAKVLLGRALDSQSGSLEIRCNARTGTLIVDGQIAAELYDQRAAVTGLTLGTHSIELRATGFKPYQDEVSVDGDTSLSILLVPIAQPPPSPAPTPQR